jgi:hypothetical protein
MSHGVKQVKFKFTASIEANGLETHNKEAISVYQRSFISDPGRQTGYKGKQFSSPELKLMWTENSSFPGSSESDPGEI